MWNMGNSSLLDENYRKKCGNFMGNRPYLFGNSSLLDEKYGK